MLKYWIKNRLVLDLAVGLFLAFLFSFAFSFTPANNYSKVLSENSIFLNSEIDFQIPNPSVDQLVEIEEKDFVNKTFGYYLTKTNVTGNQKAKVNFLMSPNMENLSITMFNDKTKIDSVSATGSYAFLDETAADAIGASVGSEITVNIASSNLTFVVTGIYERNSLFSEGTVLADFAGQVKEVYESNASSNSLSAAFIDASDEEGCQSYLSSYIPLGRLKDRSEFDSDEAYETYNNAIISGNYSNEISNFFDSRAIATTELESSENTLKIMSYVGGVVVGVVYLFAALIFRNRKSEKIYFSDVLKNKKKIKVYRIGTFVFTALVYLASILFLQLFIHSFNAIVVPTGIAVGLFLATFFVDLKQDKQYTKIMRKVSHD